MFPGQPEHFLCLDKTPGTHGLEPQGSGQVLTVSRQTHPLPYVPIQSQRPSPSGHPSSSALQNRALASLSWIPSEQSKLLKKADPFVVMEFL